MYAECIRTAVAGISRGYLYAVTSNQARSMHVTGDQARLVHVTKLLEEKTTLQAYSRRGDLSLARGFGSSLVCLMNSMLHYISDSM